MFSCLFELFCKNYTLHQRCHKFKWQFLHSHFHSLIFKLNWNGDICFDTVCVCVCVFARVHLEWQQSLFYFLKVSQVIWGPVASSSRSPMGSFFFFFRFSLFFSVPLPASVRIAFSPTLSRTHIVFSQDYLKRWGPGSLISQYSLSPNTCPVLVLTADGIRVCVRSFALPVLVKGVRSVCSFFYLTEKSRRSTHTGAELVASQNRAGWSFRKLWNWKW